jgi:hypothetical protein
MNDNKTGYVSVELSEREAELFRWYVENLKMLDFLEEQGVFDIRRGQAVITFSKYGEITWIEKKIFAPMPR